MKAALHDKVYNGYYKQTKKTDKKYKDNEKKKKGEICFIQQSAHHKKTNRKRGADKGMS